MNRIYIYIKCESLALVRTGLPRMQQINNDDINMFMSDITLVLIL